MPRFLLLAGLIASALLSADAFVPLRLSSAKASVAGLAKGVPARAPLSIARLAEETDGDDGAWVAVGQEKEAAAKEVAPVEDDSDVDGAKKFRVILYGVVSLVPILLFVPFFLPSSMVPMDGPPGM